MSKCKHKEQELQMVREQCGERKAVVETKCKWERRVDHVGVTWYIPTCINPNPMHDWHLGREFKYCPYCGKEIEVKDE